MNSIVNIQTEVRIADILELLKAETCKFYICHNVAYLIRDKLALVPGYEEYCDRCSHFNGKDATGIPYYFLTDDELNIPHNFMSPQVIAQLNNWIVKLNPAMSEFISENELNNYIMSKTVFGDYRLDDLENRIGLLEKIVKEDPDAVLSINL